MLTTSTFAASFKFVVWTVSSLYEFAVQSLHLQRLIRKPIEAWLGISMFALHNANEAFPEFDEFY